MMTKSMWALAAVVCSAACTSSSGDDSLTGQQGTGDNAATADKGDMDASVPKGPAANGGGAGSTGSKTGGPSNVSTGNASSAGAPGSKTGASGASAPRSGAAGQTGSAGTVGSAGAAGNLPSAGKGAVADDSDAGTADEAGQAAAGSGGTAGRAAGAAGMRAAAGRGAAGAGGTHAAAGRGGSEAPTTKTLDVPNDPGKTGPWPVGVRTLELDLGNGATTPVEVWYPAKPGSESEKQKVSYDLTAWLPPEHGIPADAPKVHIDCDCYRELTPDLAHGPYPVVVIVHGQASFRAAAASQMTHWASRGYIAIAADHPGLLMRDRLAGNGCTGSGIPQDVAHQRDVPAIFRALAQPEGIFGFLKGAIDAERVALGGHGDGASYASDNVGQPGVKAVFSFSHANIVPPAELGGVFYLTGQSDKIEPYNTVAAAYEATSRAIRPALLAGMSNVGHLGFTDLCGARNSDGQDAIAMARRYDICGGAAINVADQYFWDCPLSPLAGPDNYLDQAATTALVRKLSTLALEELLLGKGHAQEWADIAADKGWGELRQTR